MKISPAQVTEARRLLGWTQERLSIEARVPPTAVSTFEGGTRTGAKIETALCTALEAGRHRVYRRQPSRRKTSQRTGMTISPSSLTTDQVIAARNLLG